jgi:hypothetical protein
MLTRTEAFAKAAAVAVPELIPSVAGHAREIDQQSRVTPAIDASPAPRNLRSICAHTYSFCGKMQPGEAAPRVYANLPQQRMFPG